jgi:Zn-dependent protease/CBS domain-containing protein
MTSGLRIGKVFGITIRIDWSWLFIFVLVSWNLSAIVGQARPSWGAGPRWALAVVAALLFFASVLAHELAHSLIARSRGVPVRSITLFLFGGVSNIQRDPDDPRSELLMAIVGPLTSLVIGALLVVIVSLLSRRTIAGLTDPVTAIGRLGPVALLGLWLGYVNVVLGIFNLIPGFPLDGGRVLRSLLWMASGSVLKATRWASGVGQAIAWLMIFTGIAMVFGVRIPFFGTGLISGVWLAFIGWFLNNASVQSYQQVAIHDVLEGVSVGRLMRADPATVRPDLSVESLVYDHVMQRDERAFPVRDNGDLLGIVTVEDVRKVPRANWEVTTVRQIMTGAASLVTAAPDEEAADALMKLAQSDVNQLPVMSGGKLVGLLRRQDIVRWLQLQSRRRPE